MPIPEAQHLLAAFASGTPARTKAEESIRCFFGRVVMAGLEERHGSSLLAARSTFWIPRKQRLRPAEERCAVPNQATARMLAGPLPISR